MKKITDALSFSCYTFFSKENKKMVVEFQNRVYVSFSITTSNHQIVIRNVNKLVYTKTRINQRKLFIIY